jgi:hypothetical protein
VVGIYLLILAAPWRTSRRPTASAVGVANAISQPPPAAVTRGPVATSGKSIRLDVQTRSACWVSATADGQRVIYKTMQPGERQTIVVRDEVVLRVGDAAAFAFSIDGAPGRSLGGVGQAVTVRIAPANYDALLAKR